MNLSRVGAALAGAGMGALLVLVPAAPADAATATIAIATPSSGQVLKSTSAAVTGSATIGAGALETNYVSDLTVTASFEGTTTGSCDAASCGATVGATTDASSTFSFTPPAYAKNGPYSATASVIAKECSVGGLLGCVSRSASATTGFSVAVAPVAPRGVKTTVNGDGSVTVSWQANPEPDVIGYQVNRQPASSAGPFNTEATSYTDTSTGASGGNYSYTVTAFRPGADGTANTLLDTSSSAVVAAVPVPVVTPPPTAGQVGVGAGATTTTAPPPPPPSGGADISSFLTQAQKAGALPVVPKVVTHATSGKSVASSGSSGSFPSQTAPGPPNTYAPTLPYAGSAPLVTQPPATGGSRVPLVGAGKAGSGPSSSLLYSIAGGIFLCLLGVGLWVAEKRSGAPPLEPLDEFGEVRPRARSRGHRRSKGEAGAAVAGAAGAGAGAAARATQSPGVVIVPASVAAKAAAREAAREAARKATVGATQDIPATAVAGTEGSVFALPETDADADAAPAAADAAPAAALASAPEPEPAPQPEPAVTASPLEATPGPGSSPVADTPSPTLAPPPAPAAERVLARAGNGRWIKRDTTLVTHPSVEEAVDYFRLIRTAPTPPKDADKVEVPSPAV